MKKELRKTQRTRPLSMLVATAAMVSGVLTFPGCGGGGTQPGSGDPNTPTPTATPTPSPGSSPSSLPSPTPTPDGATPTPSPTPTPTATPTPTPTPVPVARLTADYFPLNEGDSYTYRYVRTPWPGTPPVGGFWEETQRIHSKTLFTGTSYTYLRDVLLRDPASSSSAAGGWQHREGFAKPTDMLYRFNESTVSRRADGTLRFQGPSRSYRDALLLGPVGIALGETFGPYVVKDLSVSDAREGRVGANVTTKITFQGLETVTVPAGTFTNCARVFTERKDVEQFGVRIPLQISIEDYTWITETAWYAPGVGLVKSETNQSSQMKQFYNPVDGPITQYSYTRELATATVSGRSYP
jgi:hypothetical protein